MPRLLTAAAALLAALSTTTPLAGQTAPRRPVPYPVTVDRSFERALESGTRSTTGAPGPKYWQQWTDYTITASLDPEAKRIDGTVRMVYHNRSPRALPFLVIQLLQNVHAEGAVRNRPTEVTGGMELKRVVANGTELTEARQGAIGG
ncbi:MAG: M1 family peptidase, partial [Gemmatimonadota bacterium]|nr:M1 family peptidase [Gemmatimonadota bacterium]